MIVIILEEKLEIICILNLIFLIFCNDSSFQFYRYMIVIVKMKENIIKYFYYQLFFEFNVVYYYF